MRPFTGRTCRFRKRGHPGWGGKEHHKVKRVAVIAVCFESLFSVVRSFSWAFVCKYVCAIASSRLVRRGRMRPVIGCWQEQKAGAQQTEPHPPHLRPLCSGNLTFIYWCSEVRVVLWTRFILFLFRNVSFWFDCLFSLVEVLIINRSELWQSKNSFGRCCGTGPIEWQTLKGSAMNVDRLDPLNIDIMFRNVSFGLIIYLLKMLAVKTSMTCFV